MQHACEFPVSGKGSKLHVEFAREADGVGETACLECVGLPGNERAQIGNGIAIPHGLGADRDLIKKTGVSVVQFPDGVEWNPRQTVRIVVGIAAKSDEHLEILAALTDVLDDTASWPSTPGRRGDGLDAEEHR